MRSALNTSILSICFLLISSVGSAQQERQQLPKTGEYDNITLLVENRANRNGPYTRLSINVGEKFASDLKGTLENSKNGFIRIRLDKEIILTQNEVDVMNFLGQQGYVVTATSKFELDGHEMFKHILSKPK